MTKLDKLIELNKLKKLNTKNRLEDKLKQQEYCGERKELFDPLTKDLNANNEQNLTLGEQTLGAIDWENQEFDKQSRAIIETSSKIEENASRIDKSLMMSNEALMKYNAAAEEARDKPGIIIDKDTTYIFHLMTNQSNPQLKLKFRKLDIG